VAFFVERRGRKMIKHYLFNLVRIVLLVLMIAAFGSSGLSAMDSTAVDPSAGQMIVAAAADL
jgi:hypothetical protein